MKTMFSLLSLNRNLVDSTLMASAFEVSCEELVHNLAGHVFVDEPAWHDEHVGIVVLTDEMGNLGNPAESCTDALVLVEGHVDALARAADGDAGEHFALLNALSQCMAEVRVVARLLVVRTVVFIGIALLVEVPLYELF